MNQIKIVRVTELPAPQDREASVIYIVQAAGGYAELYFTGNDPATVARGVTKADVETLVAQAIGGFADIKFVQNIAERDAITWTQSGMVLVFDASADPSVTQGAAAYLYQLSTQSFTKIYELESIDIVPRWDNLVGRPNSSPEDIDAAVDSAHNHTDLATLERYGKNAELDSPMFGTKPLVTAQLDNPGAW